MGFNPNPKLIKVSDADASIPHPVHQVLADPGRELIPGFKVRHQSPKTMRPRSFPRRATSLGSVAAR
jgi:hypothetical protein